ncbi:MAG: hypothetical protein SOV74_10285 [Coriobacteriales bacterium]|nr:hypothetical protein [Coriobacteriales bacterium]
MIIDAMSDYPFMGSKLVEFVPESKTKAAGILTTSHGKVDVAAEYDEGCRLWVYGQLVRGVSHAAICAFAEEVARASIAEPGSGWEYLAVDLRDGECRYSYTLTTDMSIEAVDRVLESMRSFAESNLERLSEMVGNAEAGSSESTASDEGSGALMDWLASQDDGFSFV